MLGEGRGIIYTRTGRRFFSGGDPLERGLLDIVAGALERSSFWEQLSTDWVVLDCEFMPWSAKAESLIGGQYASVSAAAGGALPAALDALRQPQLNGANVGDLVERFESREKSVRKYTAAWQRYYWPVASVRDLRLAPFHVLATEGAEHADKDH